MARKRSLRPAKPVVFVSHAYSDLRLAALLKAEISSCFPTAEVFVSSDPGTLPPRDPWVQTILENLGQAVLTLVVATGRARRRGRRIGRPPLKQFNQKELDDIRKLK